MDEDKFCTLVNKYGSLRPYMPEKHENGPYGIFYVGPFVIVARKNLYLGKHVHINPSVTPSIVSR